MSRNRHKGNRLDFRFVPLAHDMIDHPAFFRLSPHAKALLIDLAAQYRGDNNGDLSCAWKSMQPRGWRSEATLHKAKHELLKGGFIFEARKGRFPNVCALYALTWLTFDSSPKHDYGRAAFERRAYSRSDPLPLVRVPVKGAGLTPPRAVARAA